MECLILRVQYSLRLKNVISSVIQLFYTNLNNVGNIFLSNIDNSNNIFLIFLTNSRLDEFEGTIFHHKWDYYRRIKKRISIILF